MIVEIWEDTLKAARKAGTVVVVTTKHLYERGVPFEVKAGSHVKLRLKNQGLTSISWNQIESVRHDQPQPAPDEYAETRLEAAGRTTERQRIAGIIRRLCEEAQYTDPAFRWALEALALSLGPFKVMPGMKEDGLHGIDGFYVVLEGDTPANDRDFYPDREDAEARAIELNMEDPSPQPQPRSGDVWAMRDVVLTDVEIELERQGVVAGSMVRVEDARPEVIVFRGPEGVFRAALLGLTPKRFAEVFEPVKPEPVVEPESGGPLEDAVLRSLEPMTDAEGALEWGRPAVRIALQAALDPGLGEHALVRVADIPELDERLFEGPVRRRHELMRHWMNTTRRRAHQEVLDVIAAEAARAPTWVATQQQTIRELLSLLRRRFPSS